MVGSLLAASVLWVTLPDTLRWPQDWCGSHNATNGCLWTGTQFESARTGRKLVC